MEMSLSVCAGPYYFKASLERFRSTVMSEENTSEGTAARGEAGKV
jgi:hypothetical protein